MCKVKYIALIDTQHQFLLLKYNNTGTTHLYVYQYLAETFTRQIIRM